MGWAACVCSSDAAQGSLQWFSVAFCLVSRFVQLFWRNLCCMMVALVQAVPEVTYLVTFFHDKACAEQDTCRSTAFEFLNDPDKLSFALAACLIYDTSRQEENLC